MSEEHNRSRKVQQRLDQIRDLIETTVPELSDINFQEGPVMVYEESGRTMIYNPEQLIEQHPMKTLGDLFTEMADMKYWSRPDMAFMKQILPTDRKERTMFMTMFNEILTQNRWARLQYQHPGTYDAMFYAFKEQTDTMISGEIEKHLPDSLSFLYSLERIFWGEGLNVNDNVQAALEEALPYIQELYLEEDASKSMEKAKDLIWPIFQKLVDDAGGSSGHSGMKKSKSQQQQQGQNQPGGGQAGNSDEEGDEQDQPDKNIMQKLKDAFDNASLEKGNEIEEIQNAMKSLSEGIGKDEDSKEDFKDMDKVEKDLTKHNLPDAPDNDKVLNPGKDRGGKFEKGSDRERYPYEKLYAEVAGYISKFGRRLGSILKDNKYTRWVSGFKSGKLDVKKSYKVFMGSDRLFKRKYQTQGRNYSVALVVDESGSMYGAPALRATQSAVLLSEVLNKIGVDFQLRGFNSEQHIYKQFGEEFNWTIRRRIERMRLASESSGAGCTNDGFAVSEATLDLLEQEGEKKILIVLSDGCPSPSGSLSGTEVKKYNRLGRPAEFYRDFDLRKQVKIAEKQGVMVVGIGIMSDSVTSYYDNNVVIDDPKDIPLAVASIIRNQIKRK